jgi:hypothetical protein
MEVTRHPIEIAGGKGWCRLRDSNMRPIIRKARQEVAENLTITARQVRIRPPNSYKPNMPQTVGTPRSGRAEANALAAGNRRESDLLPTHS